MPTTAEKLRLIPKDAKYKQLISKYRKLSAGNQFHARETISDIDEYTLNKLTNNGFKIEKESFESYTVLKITW